MTPTHTWSVDGREFHLSVEELFTLEVDRVPKLTATRSELQALARHIHSVLGIRPFNAGQRWTDALDAQLREDFDAGAHPRELAERFGRTRGAIKARLVHLGLADDDGSWRRYAPRPPSESEPVENAVE